MTCPTCHGTGQIVRWSRKHYRPDPKTGEARVQFGPVVDACPTCAAVAEAEWQALSLPRPERWAAE